MNEKEKKDLALSKFILIGLAIAGVLVVVWLAWLRPSDSVDDPAIDGVNSFQACVDEGNPVQDSYPEVCVSKNGKRFSNPDQNIQSLTIKEWDVYSMITNSKDASYTYDAETDTITVTTGALTNALKNITGCTSGLRPLTYERLKPGDPNEAGGVWDEDTLKQSGVKASGYYFQEKSMIEVMCMPADSKDADTVREEQEKLRTAFRGLQSVN